MTASEIISGFDNAKSDKVVVENRWEDEMYFVQPRKRGIQSQYQPGDKPPEDIYDDTAIQANLIMAAGLSGYMTNAAQRWFELRTKDESLMKEKDVAKYFSDCAEIMYSTFAASNFYQQIHETYLDLGSVGNACLYEDEDFKDTIRFYARHPREVYIVEDDREEVTMVYRKFPMTAWQAYVFFGEKECGKAVLEAVLKEKNYGKSFDFLHYVCIRHKRDPRKKDKRNKPFASYWVSLADKRILREGGYEEFPYFYPRFYKNSGETYGYGPTYSCYTTIKRLNNATQYYEDAAYQDTYPAWLAENDGLMGSLDLRKDAMNYQRQPLSQGKAVEALTVQRNWAVGMDYLNKKEAVIKQSFFVDLFLMLNQVQSGSRTATEVSEMIQERMMILGPVLGRLQNELYNPIIYRTFAICNRAGKFPKPPQALDGVDWEVVYVSPLAKAQRAVQARDMQTFLAVIGQLTQAAPTAGDKINIDKVVDKLCRFYSVDPDIINSDDEVEAIRANRAKQQEYMAKMAAMQQGAMIAKDAGQAQMHFTKAAAEKGKV